MAVFTSTKFVKTRLTTADITDHNPTLAASTEYWIDEPYPKTCLQKFSSVMSEDPVDKFNHTPFRLRRSQRFRTQPVTLSEIHETDEENKIDNDNQQDSKAQISIKYDPLHHLALEENIRRSTRTKLPLKNFLKQQRLRTTPEELREAEGS